MRAVDGMNRLETAVQRLLFAETTNSAKCCEWLNGGSPTVYDVYSIRSDQEHLRDMTGGSTIVNLRNNHTAHLGYRACTSLSSFCGTVCGNHVADP